MRSTLPAPAHVEICTGRQELAPLPVGQVPLHAVVKSNRFVFCRPHRVPRQCNHSASAVLPNHFLNHVRTPKRGVLVVSAREAEVLSEDAGVFASQIVNAV